MARMPRAQAQLQPIPVEPHLRISRVAKMLDLSRGTVYHLIALGQLEAVQFGERTTRISASSLERLMQSSKVIAA